jgi:fimbrial isopeptide formation D2 family protein/LPXTG-motif cell wall-anchored protein
LKGLRKLLGLALTLALLFTAGITTAYAGTSGTDITVHKIQMTSLTGFPKNNPNAAEIVNIAAWFGTGATEIAGVKFNYYRVDGNAAYAAMTDADLAAVPEATLAAASEVVKTGSFVTTTTGYLIDNLADGRYVFYEDAENGLVTDSLAVPFVLNLPSAETDASGNVVYNEDGTIKYLTSMHTYPKNITEEPVPVKSIRVDGEVQDSAKVGDTVHYILTTSIPATIAKYDQFDFVDTLETTLDYADSLTVKLNSTPMIKGTGTFDFNAAGVDYFVTEPTATGGGTLTVKFTQAGLTKIGEAVNPILKVEYDAKINETAKTLYDTPNQKGDEITNSFDIKYKNTFNPDGTPGPEKTVTSNNVYAYVGGKTFIKTNDYNRTEQMVQCLEGATFDLYYDNGTNTKVTWTEELIQLNDAAGANASKFSGTVVPGQSIVLRSGTGGTFEIKGLQAVTRDFDGKYKLIETQAPAGYVKLNVPITFTVTKEGYNPAAPLQIKDAKQPVIPQTGGIGAVIFLAAGLTLMGAAVVALKTKKQTEK